MDDPKAGRLFDWLHAAGLAKYYPTFVQQGVDEDAFLRLTIQEYNRFNITQINERKALFQLIQLLKTQNQAANQNQGITPPTTGAQPKQQQRVIVSEDHANPYMPHQMDQRKGARSAIEAPSTADPEKAPSFSSGARIRCVVRKRPMNKKELTGRQVDIVTVDSADSVSVHEQKIKVDLTKYIDRHVFRFDQVFDEDTNNAEVYRCTAQPLVESIFRGSKATCFAYGQTGSGKTFTMMGNRRDGIYGMAGEDIFRLLRQPQYQKYHATVSFFEIYGGYLYDLLEGRKRLRALEDHNQNVQIFGLREVGTQSVDELMGHIDAGNNARSTGCTSANADSSRSHAILQVSIKQKNERLVGKFSFIDLAGSERGADTMDSDRQRRLEGAEINKSLLALKECIRAMDQQHGHLPFRGSKLTMVLKDSFIGDAHTVMIANISPNSGACENTLNTLRYADRVKELKHGDGGNQGQNIFPIVQPKNNNQAGRQPYSSGMDIDESDPSPVQPQPRRQTQHQGPSPQKKPSQKSKPEWKGVMEEQSDNQLVSGIADHGESEDEDDVNMIIGKNKGIKNNDDEDEELARTHEDLISAILQEEEDVIAAHRQQVDDMMELVRQEMQLLNEVESPGSSIDNYVTRLDSLLGEKIRIVNELREKLHGFEGQLKKEETLSKSFRGKK